MTSYSNAMESARLHRGLKESQVATITIDWNAQNQTTDVVPCSANADQGASQSSA